jgi:hypothetical protein
VDLPSELEDTLGRGGLSGIYVSKDADVAILTEVSHCTVSIS